ncbi:hypothetical protein D3C81_2122380 [compost metagenome]
MAVTVAVISTAASITMNAPPMVTSRITPTSLMAWDIRSPIRWLLKYWADRRSQWANNLLRTSISSTRANRNMYVLLTERKKATPKPAAITSSAYRTAWL